MLWFVSPSVQVCVPLTSKTPGDGSLATVPAVEVDPSPQSIVAVNIPIVAPGLADVKVATTPLKGDASLELSDRPATLIKPSVTLAVLLATCGGLPVLVTLMVMLKLPKWA